MRGGHGDLHPPPGEGGAQGGVVAGAGAGAGVCHGGNTEYY